MEDQFNMEEIKFHFDKLTDYVCQVNILKLPFIFITDFDSTHTLPVNITCVYFLTHQEEGLLYVGKALNLKTRWRVQTNIYGQILPEFNHSCLFPAIELGNVKLHWWEILPELRSLCESILIKKLKPKWNQNQP